MATTTKSHLESEIVMLREALSHARYIIEFQQEIITELKSRLAKTPTNNGGERPAATKPEPRQAVPLKMQSKFNSKCQACQGLIEKGEWIAWMPRKAWHQDCVHPRIWESLEERK